MYQSNDNQDKLNYVQILALQGLLATGQSQSRPDHRATAEQPRSVILGPDGQILTIDSRDFNTNSTGSIFHDYCKEVLNYKALSYNPDNVVRAASFNAKPQTSMCTVYKNEEAV